MLNMIPLNLPPCDLKIRHEKGRKEIFDVIRKKFVSLTNEEWVRQHFVHYLNREKGFPLSLMSTEHGLKLFKMQKRSDIVAFDNKGKPRLIVECKSPEMKLTQDTFDQAARYNMSLRVDYLVITNGMEHYCCRINFDKESYAFLTEVPAYSEILGA